MRYFEIILSVLAITTVFFTFIKGKEKLKQVAFLSSLTVLIFVLHSFFEGMRWQMAFIYFFPVYLGRFFIYNRYLSTIQKSRKHIKRSYTFFCGVNIFFMLLSVILIILFPIHSMAKPSGNYFVGTKSYDIVDSNRKEIYGENTNINRKIRAQIWYPADNIDEGERTPWIADGTDFLTQLPAFVNMPSFVFKHSVFIESNSYSGVEISNKEETYPVILISHGWTGFRNLHSDLAELLASHGYIVVSIDHTFGAIATVFDDGKVVSLDVNALPSREDTVDFWDYANTLVKTFSLDSELVLNNLTEMNINDPMFAGKINLDEVGVIGHSTGGGGMVRFAINDSRVKAVFGMDAWVEPIEMEKLEKGLQVPSFFLRSEQWKGGVNDDYLEILSQHSKEVKGLYQINGIYHQDFTMIYMYQPITSMIKYNGPLDSEKMVEIQQAFVLNFFDEYLRFKDTDLEELNEKFDEVVDASFE